MPARTIENYGGIKKDLLEVESSEHEESASEGNRKAVDLAMFSSTSVLAKVWFTPTATAAPTTVSPANVSIRSHFGNGSSAKPVVTKTGTGLYTLTFPTTYTDAMVPPETEDVVIAIADANYTGATRAFAQVTGWTDNVVNVALVNSTMVASDMSGAGRIVVEINY